MDTRILVGAVRLAIKPRLPTVDYQDLRKRMTYTVPNYEFTNAHKQFGWDGTRSLLRKDQTAPAGCVYRVKDFLKKSGHTVSVEYDYDYPPRGDTQIKKFALDDFQEEAVKRSVAHRHLVISAPVRAGKTAIIAAIIKRIGHFPVWVITNGNDLVLQLQEDIQEQIDVDIGAFSESTYSPGSVTVTSYQALRAVYRKAKSDAIRDRNKKIKDAVEKAKVLLIDECHHALSKKHKQLINNFVSIGYKIGLSGTPRPDGVHAMEIEEAIGVIGYKVPFKKLIETGRVAQPHVYIYDLPYAWYARFLSDFEDVYMSNIVENPFRNMFIADMAKNLIAKGKTAFIMIRRLDHGPILRALIPGSIFVQGSVGSSTRKEQYRALQEKKISCIIGSVGKEGLNIPSLNAVINAEGYKSSVATIQKLRSLTASEGKPVGLIIDFMDKGKYIRKHSAIRFEQYNRIEGFKITQRKVNKSYFPSEESRWE